MRTIFCGLLLLLAATIGAAFYFGLCIIAAEREESTYVLRFGVHPDFMASRQVDESAQGSGDVYFLETSGKIVSVDPATSEFVLTENFKNLTFRVADDTMVLINGQSAKLVDLNGGDMATVV